jgi:hypothetical protein
LGKPSSPSATARENGSPADSGLSPKPFRPVPQSMTTSVHRTVRTSTQSASLPRLLSEHRYGRHHRDKASNQQTSHALQEDMAVQNSPSLQIRLYLCLAGRHQGLSPAKAPPRRHVSISTFSFINCIHRTTFYAPAVLALMHIGCAFSHVVACDRRPASWMLSRNGLTVAALRMLLVSGVEPERDDEDERNTCSRDFSCACGNFDCVRTSIFRQP